MTQIRQNPCTIADAFKLTVSQWFYVPLDVRPATGTTCRFNLLEFGDADNFTSSTIYLNGIVGGTTDPLFAGFDVGLYAAMTSVDTGGGQVQQASAGTTLQYAVSPPGVFIQPQHPILFGAWNHAFVAVDFVTMFQLPAPAPNAAWNTVPFQIYLNGVIAGSDYSPSNVPDMQGTALITNGDLINNPPTFVHPIAVHGKELAITLQQATTRPNVPNDIPIGFAYIQAWFGKYIDPTVPANLAKFVVLDDEGTPHPPADSRAAQTAFGDSDIWLIRDSVSAVDWQDNQGTAGAFEVVGTDPLDFNPGPSADVT